MVCAWLLLVAGGSAGEFGKIDPLPHAESLVGAGFGTLDEMVADFSRPDSGTGYFVAVPKDYDGTVHFSAAKEHDVSLPYRDGTSAVLLALGSNYRQGFCAGIYLVALGKKPGSKVDVTIKDCVRRVDFGYSYFEKPALLVLAQFSKPLLHLHYYRGGRRLGDEFDEIFRIDRGKLESVLALRTGHYSQFRHGFAELSQESSFHVEGEKLVVTSHRKSALRDKPEREESFATTFAWQPARGVFAAKNTIKLELRDLPKDGE